MTAPALSPSLEVHMESMESTLLLPDSLVSASQTLDQLIQRSPLTERSDRLSRLIVDTGMPIQPLVTAQCTHRLCKVRAAPLRRPFHPSFKSSRLLPLENGPKPNLAV